MERYKAYRLFALLALVCVMTACTKSGGESRDRAVDIVDSVEVEEVTAEDYSELQYAGDEVSSDPMVDLGADMDLDQLFAEYYELLGDQAALLAAYGAMNQYGGYDAADYEPSDDDCAGVVEYEGSGDYYIVETSMGYTVLEVYGGYLWEGDRVYGDLNSYGWHYIVNRSRDTQVQVYVEDYMLSWSGAREWLGSRDRLYYSDQEDYDDDDFF